jgi:hypothetical protein
MSSPLDIWRPSKRQLEVIAECAIARIDTARTAKLLGVDEPMFAAWTKRLAAGARLEVELLAQVRAAPVLGVKLRPLT